MPHPAADHGFTLIEVLVALVIFAGTTIALQQAHIVGLRGIRLAESTRLATDLAASILSTAGTRQRLRPDSDEWGDDGPYRWHMVARKYVAPEQTPPLAVQLDGFWTTVTVTWKSADQRSHEILLETLKLQAAAP